MECVRVCVHGPPHLDRSVTPRTHPHLCTSRGASHVFFHVNESLGFGLNCSLESLNSTSSGYRPSTADLWITWGRGTDSGAQRSHLALTRALEAKLVRLRGPGHLPIENRISCGEGRSGFPCFVSQEVRVAFLDRMGQ